MKFNLQQAMIAKMTVKKVMSQIDHVEMLLAYGMAPQTACPSTLGGAVPNDMAPDITMVLADWFTEMRVHLRRIEYMTEQAAG